MIAVRRSLASSMSSLPRPCPPRSSSLPSFTLLHALRGAARTLVIAAAAACALPAHAADAGPAWTLDRLMATVDPAQDVWVFTSGGAITALVQSVLAIPDERIFELNWALVNTGVTQLRYRPGRVSLSYLNSQAHLERQRRPALITYR